MLSLVVVKIYCHKRRFILNIKPENASLARKLKYEREIKNLFQSLILSKLDGDLIRRNKKIEQQIMAWNLIKWKSSDKDYLLFSVDILTFFIYLVLIISLLIRLHINWINFQTQWFDTLHASELETISIIVLSWWHTDSFSIK